MLISSFPMRLAGKEFSLPGMPAGNWQGKQQMVRERPLGLAALCHPGAHHTRQSGRKDGAVPSPKSLRPDLFPRLDYSLLRRNDELSVIG
jgi:hypothetical protein